jgi:anti-sigma-K factor RskA
VDISEYISSGILELYVAGALEPEQMREVDEVAARHPEILAEIAAIEETVVRLVRTDRNPSPELRSAILRKIEELDGGSRTEPEPSREMAPAREPIPMRGSSPSHAMRYALMAVIVVALLSSGLAIYYWIQWQRTSMELVNEQERSRKSSDEMKSYRTRYEEASDALAVLRNPGNRVVELHGTPNAPGASARVYWNPVTEETHLDATSLPKPPAGKQYQLWAIRGGGPADAGLVARAGEEALQTMKDVAADATAFAVTLEPEGGRPTPTLDQMVVTGEVRR